MRANGRTILARESCGCFAGRGAWGEMQGGGRTVGRLFVHMYPVWLYEESLVTISIEFTVILYVRIIISEDPDYRLSHAVGPARCVCVSVCARRRREKVGILGNYDSYVQNNCKFN